MVRQQPKVSVVIPTFNRRNLVSRVVQQLQNQTYPPDLFEVIVAIDGSTDGTRETLRQLSAPFRLIVLFQQNQGAASARNLGASKASGEILLFLDDDILASPELIAEHVSFHIAFTNSVVVGPTPLAPESPVSGMTAWQRQSYDSDIARLNTWGFDAVDPYFCLGANGSVPRTLFVATGGYEQSLRAEGDEFEIGFRLIDLGASFHWNPRAVGHQFWVREESSFVESGPERRAINEFKLLQADPRFRVLSRFADLFTGPWLKIFRRRMIAIFPDLAKSISKFASLVVRLFPARLRFSWEAMALKGMSTATFWKRCKREFGDLSQHAPRFNLKMPILNYHVVRDDLPPCDIVMGIARFETQMHYLHRNGYNPIHLEDWRNWILYEKQLPPKPVILTFDDGFRDFYENCRPVLKKYGFVSTLFLVTERIGQKNDWPGIAPGEIPLLTESQIRELAAEGVSIQAHSCTHPSLVRLDQDRLKEEIEHCRADLENMFQNAPRFFAYPYGDFEGRERKMVYESGYLGACTTVPGRNTIRTDLFRLRRISISGKDTLSDFYLKLRFGFGLLSWENLKVAGKLFLRDQLGIRKTGSNQEYLL